MRYSIWVMLVAALVPFDVSVSIAHIRQLSVIDLACAAALLDVLFSLGPAQLSKTIYRVFRSAGLILWGGFLLYTLIMCFVLHGDFSRILRWGEFLFCYFLISLIPVDDHQNVAGRLSILLTLLGVGVAAWAITQFVLNHFDYRTANAGFHQHNVLAGFLYLCLPSAIASTRSAQKATRWFSDISVALLLLGMFSSASRGAILSFAVALLSLIVWMKCKSHPTEDHSRSWLSYTILACILGGFLLSYTKQTHRLWDTNGRTMYLRTGVTIVEKHPWVGIGPGNYANQIRNYLYGDGLNLYLVDQAKKKRNEFWIHLHNVYLQIAVEYGLIGLLLWLTAMGWMLYPLKRTLQMPDFNMWTAPDCFLISIVAFVLHNFVDIMFTSSFDLLIAFFIVLASA